MNLLFDIDSTITRETEFMLEYAPKYLKKKFGHEFSVINPNGYSVSEAFDLKGYLNENQSISEKDIDSMLKKVDSGFWNKYFVKYMFYPLKDEVADTIRTLKKEGNNIYFASLRGKKTHENETFFQKIIRIKIVPLLTKMQFRINHIQYDKLILVQEDEEKSKIADELKVSMVFDDQIEVLEKLNDSIYPIWIEAPHNIDVESSNSRIHKLAFSNENIHSIVQKHVLTQSTSEISNKEKTKNSSKTKVKIKNLKVYQKIYTETFFKIARVVEKKYIMKTCKPIVIGEDNILKNTKSTVFISNHRNVKDPLVIAALSKSPIHFAALKRMFEYNENMFGPVGKNFGTILTTILVRSMGCLPVARPTDDNYQITNLQTFKYIDEYLKRGSCVAIYPEGTINRNPDKDGNILSLKSNRAFKIAERGKAIVVPVSIVWFPKELKTRNRLIISFLSPIHTDELKAKEIAEVWQNSVDSAISSSNKIIEELTQIYITSSNYSEDNVDNKENVKRKEY